MRGSRKEGTKPVLCVSPTPTPTLTVAVIVSSTLTLTLSLTPSVKRETKEGEGVGTLGRQDARRSGRPFAILCRPASGMALLVFPPQDTAAASILPSIPSGGAQFRSPDVILSGGPKGRSRRISPGPTWEVPPYPRHGHGLRPGGEPEGGDGGGRQRAGTGTGTGTEPGSGGRSGSRTPTRAWSPTRSGSGPALGTGVGTGTCSGRSVRTDGFRGLEEKGVSDGACRAQRFP